MLGQLRRRLDRNRRQPALARRNEEQNGCHAFLAGVHARLEPRTYLEIGVNTGRSLALTHVPSVAVDPAFKITVEIRGDVHLVRETSDDFFARPDPLAHLRGRTPDASPTADLAFIDGMHLFEFALRDFMNVERYTSPTSVVVLDDMLPRSVTEAARDRVTSQWTGDVYKMVDVLRQHRPDLLVVPVDTKPTGVVVVFGADSSSTVLRDRYDDILAAAVVPDPQAVPASVLERSDAVAPEALLASGVWAALEAARDQALSAARVREIVAGELAPGAARVAVPAA